MPRDPNHTSAPSEPPLFRGPLFLGGIWSGMILVLVLACLGKSVSLKELQYVALIFTPVFVFFVIAWLARWRGYRWRTIWSVYALVVVLAVVAAYNGYQRTLHDAFGAWIP